MTSTRQCSRCGKPLSDRDEGLCPACLVQLGLDAAGETLLATPAPDAAGGVTRPGTPVPAGGDTATVLGPPTPVRADSQAPVRDARRTDRIGPYRLVNVLGEGGMGVVYLAEQEEPIRRTVALKLIKLGMDTREVVARFEAERQTLALMDHPNIASVLDAGATADGRPYFVMEYAPGVPITEYCDAHRLGTPGRLGLFITVCAAVQHAHQKGIIHRDLKPSNVLVVEQDGQPVPKVIDFGIAKATDQRMSERTQFTQHGLLVGTPEYMSPEQTDPTTADLDTRTDIYALGVVLYELLVGGLPFPPTRLREAGYTELLRIIREEEPAKPSARLTSLGATATDVAARRHTKAPTLAQALRGDLDWITLKALEKDRARRYGSASDLAADLTRYLQHEPVTARPPSVRYRVSKFVRRNRLGVTAAALVAATVIGGLVVSSILYLREGRAHREAVLERDRADEATRLATASAGAERQQRLLAQAATRAEMEARASAQANFESAETNLYFNNIQLADREYAAHAFGHTQQLLAQAPVALRNWEWTFLNRLVHREAASIRTDAALGSLAVTADGARLVAVTLFDASGRTSLMTWDLRTLRQTRTVPLGFAAAPFSTMLVSPDGLAVGALLWPFGNAQLEVLTANDGRRRFADVSEREASPWSFAFGPDGSRLAAALPGEGVRGSRIQTWDVNTGRRLDDLGTTPLEAARLVFSGDGRRLLGVDISNLQVIDIAQRRFLRQVPAPGVIQAAAISQNGDAIAALTSVGPLTAAVKLWTVDDGKLAWSTNTGAAAAYAGRLPPDLRNPMAFSPDGRWLVFAIADGSLCVVDAKTGEERTRLTGHTAGINAVRFLPDGRLLSAASDQTIRVWDIASAAPPSRPLVTVEIPKPEGLSDVLVSPDGRTIVTQSFVSMEGNRPAVGSERLVRIWDPVTGQSRADFRRPAAATPPMGQVNVALGAPQFSPTGATIFMPGESSFTVIDVATAAAHAVEYGTPASQVLVGASMDAVVSARGRGQTIRLLPHGRGQAATLAVKRAGESGSMSIYGMAFSPNGREVAIAGAFNVQHNTWTRDVRICETATGRVVDRWKVVDYEMSLLDKSALSLPALSRDSRFVAVVVAGRSVKILDRRAPSRPVSLPMTPQPVAGLSFSPDGTRLVSVQNDGTVTLWDAMSGRQLLTLGESGDVSSLTEFRIVSTKYGSNNARHDVAFSPDGRQIIRTTVVIEPTGARVQVRAWTAGSPRTE